MRLTQKRPNPTAQRHVRELADSDRPEVIALLEHDPARAIHLRSLIDDNGLQNAVNRGRFFGSYSNGQLTGIALLGHHILFYGDLNDLLLFAQTATESGAKGHVIFGPQAEVEVFWGKLEEQGRATRLVQDHRWYVCQKAALPISEMQLRRANLEELDVVADAQAEMALEESGVDPRLAEPEGFRQRVAARIQLGRTWVKLEDGRVVFKAELQSVTEEAVYLEGIWTHPNYRNRHIATTCLSELVHRLLRQHKMLCLAAEPGEKVAQVVYEKVGFVHTEDYQARFLQAAA